MFTCRQIYDLITEYDEGFLDTSQDGSSRRTS